MQINIYTDGAVSVNPGKGGWAWIMIDGDIVSKYDSGYVPKTTNQRMELYAAIEACRAAGELIGNSFEDEVIIHTDSAYLYNCYSNKWYRNWRANDWKNSKNQPVANQDLWQMLIPFFTNPIFSFVKVKGHDTNKWNNIVDELAVSARSEII